MSRDGAYAALLSGGKDSYLALHETLEAGLSVGPVVSVDAPEGSYLFHVPGAAAVPLIASAHGLAHQRLEVPPAAEPPPSSEAAARREVEPLADWLAGAGDDLAGLVTGAVASRFQYDLLGDLCTRHDLELRAPLWGRDGLAVLQDVLGADLAVDVVAVAADGLDRSWLGRRLDVAALHELGTLAVEHGLHPAGEGGEFETLVVDGPRFDRPLRYEATPTWDGTRGRLAFDDVWLGERESAG